VFADLHLHTIFSDGTFTPEELVARGKSLGLAAMSLTDHDTADGLPRMAAACEANGIEFISGTELTTEFEGHELHLLGYYFDPENAELRAAMLKFQEVRVKRIADICKRLAGLGAPISPETVYGIANCNSPGRPHVARALIEHGYCRTLEQAFEKFLKKGRPAWVPKAKISTRDAIKLLHRAGGVAVLAHPVLNRCDEVIPKLAAFGMDGIECYHTRHAPGVVNHYMGMAHELGLLVTGGSDCHGRNKGDPLIGTVKLPYQHIEVLKERAIKHALDAGPQLTVSNLAGR
jgi:predicted metal-dependent phosphoesterase TrpH